MDERAWRSDFKVGTQLDALDGQHKWFIAQIVDLRSPKDAPRQIRINYLNWGDKWDTWISVLSPCIAPLGMHTRYASDGIANKKGGSCFRHRPPFCFSLCNISLSSALPCVVHMSQSCKLVMIVCACAVDLDFRDNNETIIVREIFEPDKPAASNDATVNTQPRIAANSNGNASFFLNVPVVPVSTYVAAAAASASASASASSAASAFDSFQPSLLRSVLDGARWRMTERIPEPVPEERPIQRNTNASPYALRPRAPSGLVAPAVSRTRAGATTGRTVSAAQRGGVATSLPRATFAVSRQQSLSGTHGSISESSSSSGSVAVASGQSSSQVRSDDIILYTSRLYSCSGLVLVVL